jgi:hypothetical protein
LEEEILVGNNISDKLVLLLLVHLSDQWRFMERILV